MMLPEQVRMARAALGWTLKDLAIKADVNVNTISRYEAGSEILTGTMQRIEEVFKEAGVIFIDETDEFRPSIRIRKGPLLGAFQEETRFAFRLSPRKAQTRKAQNGKTKPKKPRKRMD
jgi:transcriptional regulator with XRE-family HTH domain